MDLVVFIYRDGNRSGCPTLGPISCLFGDRLTVYFVCRNTGNEAVPGNFLAVLILEMALEVRRCDKA